MKRSSIRFALSAIVACVLALVVFFADRAKRSSSNEQAIVDPQVSEVDVDGTSNAVPTNVRPDGAPAGNALDASNSVDGTEARVAASTNPLSGRVRLPDGASADRATLSLTTLVADLPNDSGSWFEVPWERVRARTVWSTTDAEGNYVFHELPNGASTDKLALWVTREACESHLTLLEPFVSDDTRRVDVELVAGAQWTAHVTDESGDDVVDATVTEIGIRGRELVGVGSDVDLAYRSFFRDWTLDSSGRVKGAAVAGTFGLLARKDPLLAVPWFGTDLGAVVIPLVLRSTFTLSGVVRGCVPTEDHASRSVLCSGTRGASRLPLMHSVARADGTFGPIAVPLRDIEELELRFDGGNCRSNRVFLPLPEVGENVFVELQSERGEELSFDVRTDDGKNLAGALVWVNWDREGVVEAAGGRTDDNGRVVVRGCRAGFARIGASAKGFVSASGTTSIPNPSGEPVKLTLSPGGNVRVKVTHAGKPVPNFDLIYEGISPSSPMGRRAALDRLDGVFMIDSVPLGTIYIIAQSADHPRSDEVTVQVQPDETVEVEIELPTPLLGRGRVVDAQTREPVANAWVQVYTNRGGIMLLPWGAKQSVDADGRFEINGFAPGETRCKVGAPGYAETYGRAIGVAGETVDLGEITLARVQELTITLTGGEGLDLTSFRAFAQGQIALEERRFSSDGRVMWNDVGFGRCMLSIKGPGQSFDLVLDLVPGRAWDFEFPIGGTSTVSIELETDPRTPEPPTWAAMLAFDNGAGAHVRSSRAPDDDGLVRFRGLGVGLAVIECFETDSGSTLAMQRVELQGKDQQIRIRLGGKSVAVRVIDKRRQPLPGAEVMLFTFEDGARWDFTQLADSDGWARWDNLNLETVDVHLYHASIGSRSGLKVALERDVNEVEFVLEADARVRVRAMDGATVLSGVPVEISDSSGAYNYGVFAGDGNGDSESRPVHAGSYLVMVRTPSLWPLETRINAREDDGHDVLQLRRRGGLELTLLDAGGARVANASVNLVSSEFHSSVSDWIARGLCSSSSNTLTTDAQGRLIIDGLPRGDYTWSCASTTGAVSVQPLTRTSEQLRLQ